LIRPETRPRTECAAASTYPCRESMVSRSKRSSDSTSVRTAHLLARVVCFPLHCGSVGQFTEERHRVGVHVPLVRRAAGVRCAL
jgi:hypothetical protein